MDVDQPAGVKDHLEGVRLSAAIRIGITHHALILHNDLVREFLKINFTPVVGDGVIGVEVVPQ